MNKKRILDISIMILIFFIVFSTVIIKPISNLDEIWNYNFAKNISEGLVPYKDFNIVVTPLLSMICAIFLKIFVNELIMMRIIETILITSILYISYKIIKRLTKSYTISIISIMGISYMFKDCFAIDYNYANLLVTLILVFMETNSLEKNKGKILVFEKKKDFIIGLIAGLTILFKQTTGICIVLACIGYKIFAIKSKDEIKEFFKIASTRLLGVIIPGVVMVCYLAIDNALYDCIDYTILGIKTFSNAIPYKLLLKNEWYIKVLSIVIPTTIILMFMKILTKKYDNKILILFAYGIASFAVVFPISDKIHFLIGSLITIISIVSITNSWCLSIRNKLPKKVKMITFSILCGLSTVICILQIKYCVDNIKTYVYSEKETELKHFYGVIETKEQKENIIKVGNYIESKKSQGQNVYILDAEAAIYMIPLDIYNKDYDLFLKGNLGGKGEEGIIEKINTEENAIYLIKKDNIRRNWQNPEEVRKYIKDNLKKTDEVYIYDVYENQVFEGRKN